MTIGKIIELFSNWIQSAFCIYGEIITEYLTNYMCFIVLSVEIFSILFTFGVVKSVVVLLFVDTAIFIGLLVVGLVKMDLRGKEVL